MKTRMPFFSVVAILGLGSAVGQQSTPHLRRELEVHTCITEHTGTSSEAGTSHDMSEVYGHKLWRSRNGGRDKNTCQLCFTNPAAHPVVTRFVNGNNVGPHSKYNLMTACKKCDKRKKRYLPLQLIYQGAAFTHHLPGDASPPVRDPTKFSLPQQNKKDIKQNNLLQQIADGMVDRGMPLHGPTFCKNFITVYNEANARGLKRSARELLDELDYSRFR